MIDPTVPDTEAKLPSSLQAIAEDLDAVGPAVPLSAADAEQLIARALREPRRRAGALWLGNTASKRRAMGAAALLLLGSSAAAAWYQHRVSEREQVQIGASGAQRDQYPTSPVAPATIPSSTVANDSPNIAPAAPVVEPVEAPVRNAPSEDLLQKANRLRREGQPREAEQTYLQLVQREPQSSSAYVARVAVAELRMGRNPASALELLRTALRQSPRGPLDIEIHQLLAQGYRATGKAGLERDELLLLSQQYPGTLAADRARARLSELGDK